MKRRDFTRITGMGILAMQSFPAFALKNMIENNSSGFAKIPLGLCNHSLRGMLLNTQQLMEYAIKQKLDSVLLNTFQPFESLEPGYLSGLSKMAKNNQVSIYIGIGSISEKSAAFSDKYGNAEELLMKGIRVASAVGSPVVGCRIGTIEDRYMDGGIEAHIEAVIKVMKSLRSAALDAGIKFAFENHAGDLCSTELLELITETGTDICGALFDPANAVWAMEDPMEALKILGSTIICTSVRDITVWETDEGATFQGMAIGEGMLDYRIYAETMAELCPQVPLHVETISNSARPIPFLKPEFWKGFPNLPAAEIISFLTMARKGKPVEIVTAPQGKSKKDFDIELQQSELLKSFDYLRKNCNAGLKS
ncbi:MAG TPA: TIM barrel protein [Bacteroidales bacterium]|nr:TIM barrel protein [Bacteroidales bacterium]